MTNEKYTFTGKAKTADGVKLRQIKRLGDGALGGWIETEANLDTFGAAWVSGAAQVLGDVIAASRSDGYLFVIAQTKTKGAAVVMAGCRYLSLDEARAHWTKTRGGTRLGDESLAIVDHLERMAKIAGWL